ncbi:MAG TPA: hypothetical protein VFX16_29165 [Pseudonocardiaceae bacterium]|nr:hypothetical protein [Pseudonocardiaceae bacterium]
MATGSRESRTDLPPLHESWLPKEHTLHKPRHGGRQRFALICALIFFAAPLVTLGVGIRPAEVDNRVLVSFPSPTRGWGFFAALPQWGSDHLTFRSLALSGADTISRGLFGEPPSFTTPDRVLDPLQPTRQSPATALAVPRAIEGRNGWLYDGDDVVSRCLPAQSLNRTIAALQRLRSIVESSGRQFVLVIAPDKSTVVPQYLPNNYLGKQCAQAATKHFWQRVPAATGALDLRAPLLAWAQRIGHPVYPPQDAHWGDEGALAMTTAIADAIQPGISRTWVSAPVQKWQQAADLPPLIGHQGLDNGEYYSLEPDGTTNTARNVPFDFTTPLHLAGSTVSGTVTQSVGYLGDSFTIRALRYLDAAFGDIDVLHYGDVDKDAGHTAGEMLAGDNVVVVELVERTLESGNSILLHPAVLNGIDQILSAHPVH